MRFLLARICDVDWSKKLLFLKYVAKGTETGQVAREQVPALLA
jgi:hypothetical protein